jgi:hypothetical protein
MIESKLPLYANMFPKRWQIYSYIKPHAIISQKTLFLIFATVWTSKFAVSDGKYGETGIRCTMGWNVVQPTSTPTSFCNHSRTPGPKKACRYSLVYAYLSVLLYRVNTYFLKFHLFKMKDKYIFQIHCKYLPWAIANEADHSGRAV